jgi:hypothetical protein
VRVEEIERGGDLAPHVRVERVGLGGAVQAKRAHARRDIDGDLDRAKRRGGGWHRAAPGDVLAECPALMKRPEVTTFIIPGFVVRGKRASAGPGRQTPRVDFATVRTVFTD